MNYIRAAPPRRHLIVVCEVSSFRKTYSHVCSIFDLFQRCSIIYVIMPFERRVDDPTPTVLQAGDVVEILAGPATGKIGLIAVDRNANFVDCDLYARPDSIGVDVVEAVEIDLELLGVLQEGGLIPADGTLQLSRRWFSNDADLALVRLGECPTDIVG